MKKFEKVKKVVVGIFVVCLSIAHPDGFAIQTMPGITVFGSGGTGGGSGGIGGGGGMPISDFPAIWAMVQGLAIASDVRCAGGAYANVLSTDDRTDRWLAAEAVFRAVKQWANTNGRWVKGGLVRGDIMNVTYADGGTESWIVVSPMSSAALEGEVSGSLKTGTGRVTPNGICPKKG